jgi:hypothetical protein
MTRQRAYCAILVCLAAPLAAAPAARANITPPSMLLVHVQPLDPNYCNLPGIYYCGNLTQETDQTGDLLFVIYLQSSWGYDGISSLDFTVRFDPGWSLWGWESCVDANFTYDFEYGSEITLHYSFPDCPVLPAFVPVFAMGVTVNNDGCLEVESGGSLQWCGYDHWWEDPLGGKAEAGVECAYSCVRNCGPWSSTCLPQLAPEEVHFEVPQGHAVTKMMHLTTTGGGVGSVAFDATEPWLSFSARTTDPTNADVSVTVDAGAWGLPPGEYSALARATCDGRACSRITLTVTEAPQSVPDDESSPPSGATPTTWGGVKNLFRVTPAR